MVIVSFLLAFIINWRGPPCLAATVVRKDKTEDRLIERRQEIEIRNNNNNPINPNNPPISTTTSNNSAAASTNNDLQQTPPPPPRKSCKSTNPHPTDELWSSSVFCYVGDCYGCYLLVIEWYTHLQVHRRGITIISVRLIIGWTWETFIASLIEFIADAQELETSTLVGVDFAITIACLLAGYLIHYFLKDWNVDLPSEEGEGRGVRGDTENPLQQQRSADENSNTVAAEPEMER